MSETMTVRLEDTVFDKLGRLAEVTERTKSFLAAQAITEYVKVQEWQLREIEQGIKEADAGDLISQEEVEALWEKRHARSLDKESPKKP